MQPHTGAVIAVINYLTPVILDHPDSFKGQSFYVRTTVQNSAGGFLYAKYHFIKTSDYNQKTRTLYFEVGKDYACFLEVTHDLSFEKFVFIKHRHTYTKEEFTIYPKSENFSGQYVSEDGYSHNIIGRKLSPKRVEMSDEFMTNKNPNTPIRRKYIFEIV